MTYVKPLRIHELPNSTLNPDIGILTDLVGQFSGRQTFYCGNLDCQEPIHVYPLDRPSFCTICGTEIDWIGITTKTIKACPECGWEYEEKHKYCKNHGKMLVSKEVPKEYILNDPISALNLEFKSYRPSLITN